MNTNNGNNSGNITITDGTNGNIALAPDGSGKVTISGGGLDVTAAGGITLQNDETITNSTNGTVLINGSILATGPGNADATITSNGDYDLILKTGNTNTGSITIADGAGGNITLAPNGIGDVLLSADTVQIGDNNSNATITTNGTGDLILNTNSGTNSGSITIADGADQNITLAPNGSGVVNVSSTTASTSASTGALTVAGGAGVTADLFVGDDLSLISDAAVLNFGVDSDVKLTHVADTGLLLNEAMQLQFRDSDIHICSDADGYMNVQADTGVNINIGGTDELAITGSTATFGTNVVVPDGATIGSASDNDAISISAGGVVNVGATTASTSASTGALTVAGGAGVAADLFVGDDLSLISDAAVLNFGADSDVKLTHVADTGLLLNEAMQLQFRDSAIHICSDADGYMNVQADTGVNINIGGTDELAITGSTATFGTNVVVPDGATIGSASDTDAISISAGGVVNVSATTASTSASTGALTVAGGAGVAADLFVGDDLSLISDAAVLNFGVDSDVKLTHVADTGLLLNEAMQLQFGDSGTHVRQSADGILAITADTRVDVAGNLAISGNLTVNGTTTTVNSTVKTVADPIMTIGQNTSDDNKDRGLEFKYHDGSNARIGFMGYDDSTSKFTMLTAATNTNEVFSGTTGTLVANLEGTVQSSTQNSITTMTGLVSTGALNSGSITSGFGNIDNGASTITTTGLITGGNLKVGDGGTISTATTADIITLAANGGITLSADVTVSDGTNDFDIASHDGTNGLKLAGTLVTATAAELNYLDITTLGTSEASKAVTADANGLITIATDKLNYAGTTVTATGAELNYLDGVTSAIQNQLDAKQGTLTFNAPSSNNANPSTSAQIKSALDGKQDTLTFNAPSSNNSNPSTSAQIKSALDGKQDTLTFNAPSSNNSNPSTSAQIKSALDGKQATITGAATTIDAEDLTVSRALISNASGKVAVSAVTDTELGYLGGVTSAIQTQINAKQATITGAATTIDTEDLTVSRALISNASGKVAVSAVTDTELGYLGGVTSAIQTQINGKQATLTYNAPSSNNGNPSTSAQIKSALDGKQDTLTFNAPSSNNSNPSTSAQIKSALDGKQDTLTFGINNTNAVKVNDGSVMAADYARFTAEGLEGISKTDVKTDLALNNVENTAISTWTGSSNVTTVGALNSGSITSGFGNIDNGTSTITTTGLITGGNLKVSDGGTIGSASDTDAITIASNGVVTFSAGLDVTAAAGITLQNDETITNSTNGTVLINGSILATGAGNADATITSNGAYDLILNTNSGNSSGSITITDGANENIVLAPNGTGKVNISGGGLNINSSAEDAGHAQPVPITNYATWFKTAGAETSTLEAGTEGQMKLMVMDTDNGNMVCTVTNPGWGNNGEITFGAIGQSVLLQYINSKWFAISANGVTFDKN